MSTLHTVSRSPFERTSLASCLRVVRPGSAVLLIEDAVYAALAGTRVEALVRGVDARVAFYVLAPDLAARGFTDAAVLDRVGLVDHGGFVDLAVAHDRVQAWP